MCVLLDFFFDELSQDAPCFPRSPQNIAASFGNIGTRTSWGIGKGRESRWVGFAAMVRGASEEKRQQALGDEENVRDHKERAIFDFFMGPGH